MDGICILEGDWSLIKGEPEVLKGRYALRLEGTSLAMTWRGCRFHPRCSEAMPICQEEPKMREIEPRHLVACHLYD